jgi:hypothetical protein
MCLFLVCHGCLEKGGLPRCQDCGCRSGAFMRAVYSICLPMTGWTTAFARCCWDQWYAPKAISMLADSMFQKSSCDKFLGEIFCERVGTLRGAARPVSGVTTLGINGVEVVSPVLIVGCDLAWYCCCMGEVRIGCSRTAGLFFRRPWQVHLKVQEL